MQDIKTIVNHLFEKAKKNLLKKGKLEPKLYFLILYPGQKTAVYYPVSVSEFFRPENKHLKRTIPLFTEYTWQKKKNESPPDIELKAVCFINDFWVSEYNVDKTTPEQLKNAPLPSKDPKRKEAIQLVLCERDKRYGYTSFYNRQGNKIIFKDPTKMENDEISVIGGWVAELFPKTA